MGLVVAQTAVLVSLTNQQIIAATAGKPLTGVTDMTLSRLTAACATCRFRDTCDHKLMEMVGFLEPTAAVSQQSQVQPLTVPHDYRQVKIAPNTTVTVDLEDLKKEIEKSIAKSAGLYGGFFQNCT